MNTEETKLKKETNWKCNEIDLKIQNDSLDYNGSFFSLVYDEIHKLLFIGEYSSKNIILVDSTSLTPISNLY